MDALTDTDQPLVYEQIRSSVADRIATITLHRPEARNGYTVQMADELAAALAAADADDDVRVIVLTGAGTDFCVGMDLSAGGLDVDPAEVASGQWVEPATRVTSVLHRAVKPVVVAVHGAAVGVGSTMILAADYRLASSDARFGFVFSRRGIYPEGGSTWFLPRIVGLGRATDWMISGRVFDAQEALTAGLVHSVHAPGEVLAAAHELAKELVERTAPVSVAVIRQALLHMSGQESPEVAFALDSRLIAGCATSQDAVEGIVSFLQRRPPAFTGTPGKDLPDYLPWRT
jgi:enoyl-CoA hydratase/carnithine racemase